MRARWAGVNPALVEKALEKAAGYGRPTGAKLVLPSAPPPRPHKYGAKRTMVGAEKFPSKKEAARYEELMLLQRAGRITELTRQNAFELVVNGVTVARYVSDFGYLENGLRVIEDCKGFRTPVYRLKKKMMAAQYGIEIKET